MADAEREIQQGNRFAFGANWLDYATTIDQAAVDGAVASLREMLDVEDLVGVSFVDVGCGSGLFSLAAVRLGARVHSFDFDPDSVKCTEAVRSRWAPDSDWVVERGSILDSEYTAALGRFDVVYSWGVLHHTGDMWSANDAAGRLVADGGLLYIALYNDQGFRSKIWAVVKRRYNDAGPFGRRLMIAAFGLRHRFLRAASSRFGDGRRRDSRPDRSMNDRHDLIDWIGGWPFEVASPGDTFTYFKDRGFELRRLATTTSYGCNEYVFELPDDR